VDGLAPAQWQTGHGDRFSSPRAGHGGLLRDSVQVL
jgi:hypothetical protein